MYLMFIHYPNFEIFMVSQWDTELVIYLVSKSKIYYSVDIMILHFLCSYKSILDYKNSIFVVKNIW